VAVFLFKNGNAGMDSSRSGLLSTLLMTLPLIVVPAIALLRPPGPVSGVSTTPLDASDASVDEFLSDSEMFGDDAQKTSEKPSSRNHDEFDGIFEEQDADVSGSGGKATRSDRTNSHGESNPFLPVEPLKHDQPTIDPEQDEVPDGTAETIVETLNSQGALKTMWFEAGPKSPVGLAAFFRGQTELVRIRFEAVGQTREECARNVLDQVTKWQSEAAAGRQ
jgi:hypothetical protein